MAKLFFWNTLRRRLSQICVAWSRFSFIWENNAMKTWCQRQWSHWNINTAFKLNKSFRYSYQKSIISSFRLACIFSIEYLTKFWVYGSCSCRSAAVFNPIYATGFYLYRQKIEDQIFSNVFRGYRRNRSHEMC